MLIMRRILFSCLSTNSTKTTEPNQKEHVVPQSTPKTEQSAVTPDVKETTDNVYVLNGEDVETEGYTLEGQIS